MYLPCLIFYLIHKRISVLLIQLKLICSCLKQFVSQLYKKATILNEESKRNLFYKADQVDFSIDLEANLTYAK